MFTKYHASAYVPSVSDDEYQVSAYTSSNTEGALTVSLVNRSMDNAKDVEVKFTDFILDSGPVEIMTLNNLPHTLSFQSHNDNALQVSAVTPGQNTVTLTMPAMSVATFVVEGHEGEVITSINDQNKARQFMVYPNPASGALQIDAEGNTPFEVSLYDISGKRLIHEKSNTKMHSLDLNHIKSGTYILNILDSSGLYTERIMVK